MGARRSQPAARRQLRAGQLQLVGRYTLGGFAFQDDFLAPYGRGLGTSWRTYDTKSARWACRWLQAGTDASSHFTNDWFYGRFAEGEMRLRGLGSDAGGAFQDRIVFSEITDESFVWTLSRTRDEGLTWIEALTIYRARRTS